MSAPLPDSRQALEDVYTTEDPWHTRKIPEKRARYAALRRLVTEWEVPSALEISSGEGDFADGLRAFARRVEACDIAQTAVSRAAARYPEVSFFQADAKALDAAVFKRHSLVVWLDSLYWLTREDTRDVLRRARDAGVTHFLFSVRITPRAMEYHWKNRDFDNPGEFDAFARGIFPTAECIPMQLHLWMRPLGSRTFRAKIGCVVLRSLNKTGLYRLALWLTQRAYRHAFWRAFVDPWIVHMAARVEPAEERMRRLLPLTEDVTDHLLNRPLAARIVPWLVSTPITPNQVTAVSFALGLGAVAAILLRADLAAAALLVLSIVVDCVDGQLARAKNMASEWGDVFDHTSDDAAFVLTSLALAHRLGDSLTLPAVAGLCGGAFAVALLLTVSQYVFSHEAAGLIKNRRAGRLTEDRGRVKASYQSRRWSFAQAPGKVLLGYFRFRLGFIHTLARSVHPRAYSAEIRTADPERIWEALCARATALKAWRLAGISSVSTLLAFFLAAGAVERFPAVFLVAGFLYFLIAKGLTQRVSLD